MTPPASRLAGARAYMNAARDKLDAIQHTQIEAMDQAATAMARTIQANGLIYLFGTGHSHMMAEEGHYRAGGFAAVCPVLASGLMLHEGAVTSSTMERTSGVGPAVLARYQPTADDVLVVFSNSGVNAVPVETALAGKAIGMTVIGVVSLDYAAHTPAGPTGKKLADVADIVLDNQGVPGDALVAIGDTGLKVGPLSTLAGAFILNAVLTEVAWRLHEQGIPPPVYISANMPGSKEHNLQLVEQFRARNPHL